MKYSEYLQSIFGPGKVQKISINAGFSCPNRDGTVGTSGCIYCDNSSFTPAYCMQGDSVAEQLQRGIAFFSRKYSQMRYLAYFQSFTNTYGRGIESLRQLYEEAAGVSGVVGIVIGTRPDTLTDEVLDLLEHMSARLPVLLEIGAETSCDATLQLIHRGHTWGDVESAVRRASVRGLHCGLHLIAGLPGESRERSLQSVADACRLPIRSIKLHQLQILRGTPLCRMWKSGEICVKPFELEEYIDFCRRVIEIVPKDIVIERFLAQAPPHSVIAPRWGIKNYQFAHMLERANQKKICG